MTMTTADTNTNRTGVLKLWLLNLVANALFVLVAYYWLLIPDAHGWQVGATAFIALSAGVLLLWLRVGTLAWFRVGAFRRESGIGRAYSYSFRFIPALAFWAVVFVVVAWGLWSLREFVPQFAVWLRQSINAGPPPRNLMKDLNWLLLLVVCYLWPGLWIPIATTVAASGVHPEHLARSRRVWRRPLYWLWLAVLLALGVYLPYRLVWWIPDLQTLRQQAWSMGARFLLAYLIAITAFIAIVWMAGVFTEREDPIEP